MAESGGDTKKVSSLGVTRKYGLFQMESEISCANNYDGGYCKIRCDCELDSTSGITEKNDYIVHCLPALLTDELDTTNMDCAKTFLGLHGFKGWRQWELNCKQKQLPNIQDCLR